MTCMNCGYDVSCNILYRSCTHCLAPRTRWIHRRDWLENTVLYDCIDVFLYHESAETSHPNLRRCGTINQKYFWFWVCIVLNFLLFMRLKEIATFRMILEMVDMETALCLRPCRYIDTSVSPALWRCIRNLWVKVSRNWPHS